MTAKYKGLSFQEPDSDLYRKIKATEILSLRELEFLSYIARLQPCTVSAILDMISRENKEYSQSKVVGFNKITKPFKDLGVIKVVGFEKSEGRRKKEVIELTGKTPTARKKNKRPDKKLEGMVSSSVESALLAIEVYNKPRISFRIESYFTLMNIAWTKIMHAYFRKFEGEIYYSVDNKTAEHIKIDGEKKTWSLSECISNHKNLQQGVRDNLNLAINLRNKIVHGYVDSTYLEGKIYGQSQALLHNYEKFLKTYFDGEYKFDTNIHFSLQISTELLKEQEVAIKRKLAGEVKNICQYIDKYNSTIQRESFDSKEYSYRVALRPIVSNSGRNADVSVVFDRPVDISEIEKVKVVDKYKTLEVVNPGKYLPSAVVRAVRNEIPEFNMNHHTAFLYVFQIRPPGDAKKIPPQVAAKTNQKFCHFDDPVKTFLYTEKWVKFLIDTIALGKISLSEIRKAKNNGENLKVEDFN